MFMRNHRLFAAIAAFVGCLSLTAQSITLPPSGDNQKSAITQYMGALASVTVTYNSPDVDGREGKIWGELVPYGLTDLGFGPRRPAPWRAGANENTTVAFSHDVLVEGKPLQAGVYGLHLIVTANGPWTAIFSKNHTAWGSYFYRPQDDALRVEITPEAAEFHEWLSYEFTNREPDACTLALFWEKIKAPIRIALPNAKELYVTEIRRELENAPGFQWQNWEAAARYCINNKINLEEALQWAENAISLPFVGEANFSTYSTKAMALHALNRNDESAAALKLAIEQPTATANAVHQLGRELLGQGRKADALMVFQLNHQRFSGAWPTEVGLARGLSANGQYAKALQHARRALEQAPDDLNRNSLRAMIAKLEAGQDAN